MPGSKAQVYTAPAADKTLDILEYLANSAVPVSQSRLAETPMHNLARGIEQYGRTLGVGSGQQPPVVIGCSVGTRRVPPAAFRRRALINQAGGR
jgi:hypothetical protein